MDIYEHVDNSKVREMKAKVSWVEDRIYREANLGHKVVLDGA